MANSSDSTPISRAPIRLRARFQHYAWGDDAFIPRLYGLPNPTSQPYAEAWIGAHPALPAMASVGGDGLASAPGQEIPLNRLLAEQRDAILGADVRARFRGLPYLVK